MNVGKTEFIWLGTRQQLAKLSVLPLQIKNQIIMPVDKVRDLGVIIDSKLTMESHTANVVRGCFYQLRQLQSIRRLLLLLMLGAHSLLLLWLTEWTTATRCCMARLVQSHASYRWY